jgi:hypothetical protein
MFFITQTKFADMKIQVSNFSGVVTRLAPHLIPNEAAQSGETFHVEAGDLRPALSLGSTAAPTGLDGAISVGSFQHVRATNFNRWVYSAGV